VDKSDNSAAQELKEFLTAVLGKPASPKIIPEDNSVFSIVLWTTDESAAEKFINRFSEVLSRVATRQFSFNIRTVYLTNPVINWDNILLKSRKDFAARVIFVLADTLSDCPPKMADVLVSGFSREKVDKRYFYIDLAVEFLSFMEKLNAK